MKKNLTLYLALAGIIFIVGVILLGIFTDYRQYYYQSGDKILFYFNRKSYELILLITGIALVNLSVIRIKKYTITKWVLFSVCGLLLLAIILLIIDEFNRLRNVGTMLVVFTPVVLCAGIMVMALLFKRKLWTKVVLIVGVSFVLLVSIWVYIDNIDNNSYSKDWEHIAVVMQDSEDNDRKVYLQHKNGERERYIVSKKVFPGIYNYITTSEYTLPEKEWEVVSFEHLGNIKLNVKVKNRDELKSAIDKGTYGSYIIAGKINLLGDWLVKNQEDIMIKSASEAGEAVGEINSSTIPIMNCKNITISGLKLSGTLEFDNCSNININNCEFTDSESYSVYVHDNCNDISINNCSFNKYDKYAINIPGDIVLKTSGNNFNGENEFRKIMIRDCYSQNYSHQSFYKSLFCNSFYLTGENEKHYFSGCNLGIYTGSVITEEWGYNLMQFFSDNMSNLNLNDYYTYQNYLDVLSGGIAPTLNTTYKSDYSSRYEIPSFKYYNPRFIRYWMENMKPSPYDYFGNWTFQVLYDNSFRSTAQLLFESYLMLQNNYNIENEAIWYIGEAKENNWEFSDVLRNRYNYHPLTDEYINLYELNTGSTYIYQKKDLGLVVGFWLRRHIGGTDELIFEYLSEILREYDPSFYSWILSEYD